MKYAIIKFSGQQHLVEENQELLVPKVTQAEGESFDVTDVLLIGNDETKKIGMPLVENAKVTLKVIQHGKAPKIRVATYKAKSRQRKVRGHKQEMTTVKVESISL